MNWTVTVATSLVSSSSGGIGGIYIFLTVMFYALIGGYAVSSLLLLRFPGILHKKKTISFEAFKISHRGGSGEAIENTITAYKKAIEAGTEMLEIDCQLTSDGEVVVVHDLNLSVVAEQPVMVCLTSYKNLPLYKPQVPVTFKRNCLTNVGLKGDRKIPLLREVFQMFPDVPINIDIKMNSDELISKVSSLIKEFNREEITVWGAFTSKVSRRCHTENPAVPMFCSMNEVLKIVASFYIGLLPFLPIKETFFEIGMPSIAVGKNKFADFTFGRTVMIRIVDFLLMNRFLFSHLQRRGMRVYVWVLNHEDQFDKALHYGVDGIMTDFPSNLTRYLNDRNALKSEVKRNTPGASDSVKATHIKA